MICGILIMRMANGQYTVYKSVYALTVTFEPTFLIFYLVLAYISFVKLVGPRILFRRTEKEKQEDKKTTTPTKTRGPRFTPPKPKRKKS